MSVVRVIRTLLDVVDLPESHAAFSVMYKSAGITAKLAYLKQRPDTSVRDQIIDDAVRILSKNGY